MKKSARRMASTTSVTGDTSSKQQQAQRKEITTRESVCVFNAIAVTTHTTTIHRMDTKPQTEREWHGDKLHLQTTMADSQTHSGSDGCMCHGNLKYRQHFAAYRT